MPTGHGLDRTTDLPTVTLLVPVHHTRKLVGPLPPLRRSPWVPRPDFSLPESTGCVPVEPGPEVKRVGPTGVRGGIVARHRPRGQDEGDDGRRPPTTGTRDYPKLTGTFGTVPGLNVGGPPWLQERSGKDVPGRGSP